MREMYKSFLPKTIKKKLHSSSRASPGFMWVSQVCSHARFNWCTDMFLYLGDQCVSPRHHMRFSVAINCLDEQVWATPILVLQPCKHCSDKHLRTRFILVSFSLNHSISLHFSLMALFEVHEQPINLWGIPSCAGRNHSGVMSDFTSELLHRNRF